MLNPAAVRLNRVVYEAYLGTRKIRAPAGGLTLGNYITGKKGVIEADANNTLFQHEYGHVLQSRAMGFAYIPRVGIPSIFSAASEGDHDFFETEQDANYRGFKYFNKHVDGFYEAPGDFERFDGRGWDFENNPLDPNREASQNYWDYRNPNHLNQLGNLKISPNWYDYVFGILLY